MDKKTRNVLDDLRNIMIHNLEGKLRGTIYSEATCHKWAILHGISSYNRDFEVLSFSFLDKDKSHIAFESVFTGTVTSAPAYFRPVLRKAIDYNAEYIIMGHNHPSGTLEPSQSDIRLTRELNFNLSWINKEVLEHFISTNDLTKHARVIEKDELTIKPSQLTSDDRLEIKPE